MPDKKQKAKSKKKKSGNEDRIDSVLDAGSGSNNQDNAK